MVTPLRAVDRPPPTALDLLQAADYSARMTATAALSLALLAILLFAFRARLLRSAVRPLVRDDPLPERCDAIVLMNGNISTRPYLAARLHGTLGAPVLIARLADTEEVRLDIIPNVSEATRRLLIRRGVPPESAVLVDSDRWVAGTWAEALVLCPIIAARGWRRIVIVTDCYHSRRAHWTFRRVLGDSGVEVLCAATPWSLSTRACWWRSEYGLVQVAVEYLKFLHYFRLARRRRGAIDESALPPARTIRQSLSDDDGSP